ncbi:PhzF family phenazine biosynthesis protein [Jannaschia pohangensis]|uniref:Phenazine biosynthesis protein PhzF family n=1 Tax=Jannaschia pohangensis TaxID=390807 RepID=A0A1I3JN67_9RHOB|nr:PhzF family phenazine biosynthesis isomerase [Jannaschia pohangensis]SFI61616.1 phenazine biosynthesis protein PhzF family [Jannaschia pohangensis]
MTVVSRIAAFADHDRGGNPAGVALADHLPDAATMQAIARDIGYSETVFAAPIGDRWITRYYSPEAEVAFCGHATIALGAELGARFGAGTYALSLSGGNITVTARAVDGDWEAELTSPPTWSRPLDSALLSEVLDLFSLLPDDLDSALPPTLAHAGVQHAVVLLRDRARLATMDYDLAAGRDLMAAHDLTTISLLHRTSDTEFAARNAFAIGGVLEDPATGAAAAALAGALVDLDWPALRGGGTFTIRQGEDMGAPSRLTVTTSDTPGAPVRVAGRTRPL